MDHHTRENKNILSITVLEQSCNSFKEDISDTINTENEEEKNEKDLALFKHLEYDLNDTQGLENIIVGW